MKFKFLENWQKDLLSPILVNLSTACIIFFLVVLFKPVILEFFSDKPKIEEYPLLCATEAYRNPADGKQLIVDFFIINRGTNEDYTQEKLREKLKTLNPNSNISLSPDIVLKYKPGTPGLVAEAYDDEPFNDDKGKLHVTYDDKSVKIVVKHIDARAILKATIVVDGMLRGDRQITKSARNVIPFNFREYEEACYQKK